jgi:hypothetical protein
MDIENRIVIFGELSEMIRDCGGARNREPRRDFLEKCGALRARLAPLAGRDDILSAIPAMLRNPFATAVKLMS